MSFKNQLFTLYCNVKPLAVLLNFVSDLKIHDIVELLNYAQGYLNHSLHNTFGI